MKRVIYLIDGFNLYHSTKSLWEKKKYKVKWLDIKALCQAYLHLFGKDAVWEDIFYFSAIQYYLAGNHPDKIQRHNLYIRCLENSGIKVELGRFKEKEIYCQKCRSRTIAHEEKETDVAIGVKLTEICFRDLCEFIVLVTGDTDLSPAVKRCQQLFPQKEILFAFPFDRKNRELLRLSPKSFSINRKQYLRYQFPDPLTLSDGTRVNKPVEW